jgi:hypothetical protein
VRERQTQTTHQSVHVYDPGETRRRLTIGATDGLHAGSRLKSTVSGKVLSYMPAFQPYRGKPAVRNDREGRGNVGIIRSPVRASTLPDGGGREVTRVPTAKASFAASAHVGFWHKAAVSIWDGMSAAGES